MNVLFSGSDNWYPAIIGSKAVILRQSSGILLVNAHAWYVVVVDQFTTVYLLTPTPKFIQNQYNYTINYLYTGDVMLANGTSIVNGNLPYH